MALTHSVTYECDELNLLPSVRGAQCTFTGYLHMSASTAGSWIIESIDLSTANAPLRGCMPIMDTVTLDATDPLFRIICAAAQAYDKATGFIRGFIVDELTSPEARAAALSDHERDMRRIAS